MKKYRFKKVYADGIHDFEEAECETIDEAFRTAILIMICKKAFNSDISHIDVYDGKSDKKLFTFYR